VKKAFRRGFLLGIGLARLTAREIGKEVKQFARENQLDKKEADSLAREFMSSFEKEKKTIVHTIRKETKDLEGKFRKELARHLKPKRTKK
jgi:hypothetical protein